MIWIVLPLYLLAHTEQTTGRELRALEQTLTAALHRHDQSAIEDVLADDYVLRSQPDVSRATWIHNAVTRCWGDRFDISGFKARVDGDSAIATFVLTSYVDPETCHPAMVRSLITDAWARRNGQWRLRLRHSGPVPANSEGLAGQYGFVAQPPPRWKVDGELAFVGTGGNTSTHTLGLTGAAVHRAHAGTTEMNVSFVTSGSQDATQARSLDAEARHRIHVRKALDLVARGSYARDRFAGIAGRIVTDAGISYAVPLSVPGHRLSLDAGAGFTSENRLNADSLQFATATAAMAYKWRITPGTELHEDLGIAPDLAAAGHWRATQAVSFVTTMTSLLSFKFSQRVEYRHEPVPGFGRVDTKTSAALVFSFRTLH